MKNATIVQMMVIKKIPSKILIEIPLEKNPKMFLKITPIPAKVGNSKITINIIYSIKKDCLKISNLFYNI